MSGAQGSKGAEQIAHTDGPNKSTSRPFLRPSSFWRLPLSGHGEAVVKEFDKSDTQPGVEIPTTSNLEAMETSRERIKNHANHYMKALAEKEDELAALKVGAAHEINALREHIGFQDSLIEMLRVELAQLKKERDGNP
jgi:hypothetical protein